MKNLKLYFPILFLLLSCQFATAQVDKKNKSKQYQQNNMQSEKMGVNDGIMMENGRMMMRKNGQNQLLKEDMTLSNGTKVMRDGTVMMKNGEKVKMADGDMIMMTGEVKRGGLAAENENAPQDKKKTEYYYDTKYVESPLYSNQIEQRMELMDQKMFLMSEKMRLMNEKMSKMSSNGNTTDLDNQLQNLDKQLKQLDAQIQKK